MAPAARAMCSATTGWRCPTTPACYGSSRSVWATTKRPGTCRACSRETTVATIPPYAELLCLTNFSFLRGASQPEELVERAKALGYTALAITDECSMAGIVRAHVRAKELELPLIVGSQFEVDAAAPFRLAALATNLNGYGNLCQFITRLRRASEKGTYHLR